MAVLRSWGTWIDAMMIAPNAAPSERALGYGAGGFGAVLAGALAVHAGLPAWALILLAVVGFDIFGGVVVNATPSGSRRFHSPGAPRWSGLGFVACHVHPLAFALLLPEEMPWTTASAAYACLVLSSVLVTVAPRDVYQPVAFLCAGILIAVFTAVTPPAPVISWLIPLLAVKLLLSHLLLHAPRKEP